MWRFGVGLLLLGGLLLGIGHSLDVYGQVRKIVGTAADITPPPPPVGCTPSSTFNIVAGSSVTTYSTGGATSTHGFGVATRYQNYIGAAFQVGRDTTGGELFVGSVVFSPPRFTTSIEFSTANNPVVNNTYGTIIDQTNSRALVHATRVVAPCAGTNCLQLLLYSTTDSTPVLVSDVTFSSLTAGQGTFGGVADGTYFYFLQRNAAATATNVFQFTQDSSLTFVNSASIGNISPNGMVDDGTNLWIVNSTGITMVRINKTTLATTAFPITSISGTLTDQVGYDAVNNHFYVATTNAGITTVRQLNGTTFAGTGLTNSLGTETLLTDGIMVDAVAGKLYLATDVTGTTARLRRYALNTFGAEQTTSFVSGQPTTNAGQDYIHKRIWTSGIGSPGYVVPFTLCS